MSEGFALGGRIGSGTPLSNTPTATRPLPYLVYGVDAHLLRRLKTLICANCCPYTAPITEANTRLQHSLQHARNTAYSAPATPPARCTARSAARSAARNAARNAARSTLIGYCIVLTLSSILLAN